MKSRKKEGKEGSRIFGEFFLVGIFSILSLLALSVFISATPTGPSTITSISNSSLGTTPALSFNLSGGNIGVFNLTANVQDPRWKGFVGNASGSFTLSDASGSTLYNWNLASITGKLYATRYNSNVNWAGIQCANLTTLVNEDNSMNLTDLTAPNDNLTQTFNCTSAGCAGTNAPFYVGAVYIAANTCPTLFTYTNTTGQSLPQNSFYQETALYAPSNVLVYETPIEPSNTVGYNGQIYNFQMIVPENGTIGFNSSTAYYLYVELGS